MFDAVKALFADGFQYQDLIDAIKLIVEKILAYVSAEEGYDA